MLRTSTVALFESSKAEAKPSLDALGLSMHKCRLWTLDTNVVGRGAREPPLHPPMSAWCVGAACPYKMNKWMHGLPNLRSVGCLGCITGRQRNMG